MEVLLLLLLLNISVLLLLLYAHFCVFDLPTTFAKPNARIVKSVKNQQKVQIEMSVMRCELNNTN